MCSVSPKAHGQYRGGSKCLDKDLCAIRKGVGENGYYLGSQKPLATESVVRGLALLVSPGSLL